MKSILIGFDAFDPEIFERLSNQGRLPNLTEMAENGAYARFGVSNPPQSEVSWTSIATGLNPGGHGIFDFVHRNPADYHIHVSLLPTKRGALGTRFIPPHNAKTLFQDAVDQGYPATSLWWPATFPARLASPVRTIPGLGTPDILGRLGAGYFFSPDPELPQADYKTHLGRLVETGSGSYKGMLPGPLHKKKGETARAVLEFSLVYQDAGAARLEIANQQIDLQPGVWSRYLRLAFRVKLGFTVHAITRAILSKSAGTRGVYFLPLQIDPAHSIWHYASPTGFMKSIWKEHGPFLTLGWPQDTTGLEEGFLTDEAFLALCDSILATRARVFEQQLSTFEEGVLAIVFDSLDRIQHMFWRDDPIVIETWYEKLDTLLGRLIATRSSQTGDGTRLFVLSDHGFTRFDHKVHLNRWLQEQGYLAVKPSETNGSLNAVDWSKTKAYAVGLNSIYLNRVGREAEGIVQDEEYEDLRDVLVASLKSWVGNDGGRIIHGARTREQAFEGPLSDFGPDLLVGYERGYRASSQTGLGGWGQEMLESNGDHWGGDHCIDPELVPGVLFGSAGLEGLATPTYRDIPQLVLGTPIEGGGSSEIPEFSEEDREVLEERLKDLGYL